MILHKRGRLTTRDGFFLCFFLHKKMIFHIFIPDLQMIIYEIQALQSTSNYTFTLFV